jgi:thiol:disulfide interchange protein DsbD
MVVLAVWAGAGLAVGQGFEPEPVFAVQLVADREPVVAGGPLRAAAVITIDAGWHINSDDPGDDFLVPTTVEWKVPEGWPLPARIGFPDGVKMTFDFADGAIEVWEGTVVVPASFQVPETALGPVELQATVTAQACNDRQCLPPLPLVATARLEVAPPGTASTPLRAELFAAVPAAAAEGDTSGLAGLSLPVLLITVFLAGLALNLTPCVYPLIPITVGFFAQQAKERSGGTLPLAIAYVLGMAVTYSTLGVVAALTGQLFGAALQSPAVIAVIVAVMLALAASMFGLWELQVPEWAQRASGGQSGVFGALIMGLVVGFVAAPCIGPFVLGLLTFVGQQGSPVLGFVLFFTLAMGLGLPYLLLGTFTGSVQRLPMAGEWMVGVRKVFGVLLIALAAYFARPLLPGAAAALVVPVLLVLGGLYLLVIERTGHGQPVVDRVMRLVCVVLVVVGAVPLIETFGRGGAGSAAAEANHLEWAAYDADDLQAAIATGGPVIVDFYADWCAPCRELDEKTFADPRVAAVLEGYTRIKVDQTKSTPEATAAAQEFSVLGVPTVIAFEGGEERFRITGFEPADDFLKRLEG